MFRTVVSTTTSDASQAQDATVAGSVQGDVSKSGSGIGPEEEKSLVSTILEEKSKTGQGTSAANCKPGEKCEDCE